MREATVQEYSANGTLAYLDAFTAGLVAVKVLEVVSPQHVKVVVTATTKAHLGYARGTVMEYRTRYVVPRDRIFVRDGKYRIRDGYRWV